MSFEESQVEPDADQEELPSISNVEHHHDIYTTDNIVYQHEPRDSLPLGPRVAYTFRPPTFSTAYDRFMPSSLVSWASTGKDVSPRPLLRPCMTYHPSSPPASVRGQLVYQIGKLSPLTPLFSSFQLKSPPNRESLNDLRLSASQRDTSCYSTTSRPLTSSKEARTRPQTAPSSAAARIYGKKADHDAISPSSPSPSRARRPATAATKPPAPSHLIKASAQINQSISQGLSAHNYVHRPFSPSSSHPMTPRASPPTAMEARSGLILSQEKGPGLKYKDQVTRMKQLA